ncbi:MAG: ABC transporter permease [Candidatus Bathyarchaeia archaeon]
MNGFMRNMLAMIELEMRKLRHDRTELYTRAIQPILWIAVFGPIMGNVRAIPTGGIPYTDYITPGALIQSTTFVSIFYGLTIVWERESGILKSSSLPRLQDTQ